MTALVPAGVFTDAVRQFWAIRARGVRTGQTMHGFARTIAAVLTDAGVRTEDIFTSSRTAELPGFYRVAKRWDVVVLGDGQLRAAIELKSQVGSLGNNFNNRAEEALGNAVDLWTAYREGAFATSPAPWLGYVLLLGDEPGAQRPVGVGTPLFLAFPEFEGTSYARRYELLCRKLVRERQYNAACFIVADPSLAEVSPNYDEPAEDLTGVLFLTQLLRHVSPG
jgi:hypothetical protein